MFAVINVVPRRGDDSARIEATAEAGPHGYHHLGTAWNQSLGTASEVALAAQWGRADGEDLYYPEYDSPQTNHGIARDLDWEEYWSLQGKVRHHGLTVQGLAASRRNGIPTGSFGVIFNDRRSRSRDAGGRLEVRLDHVVRPGLEAQLRGSAGRTTYEGEFPFPLITTSYRYRELATGDWVGAEGRLGWEHGAGHRLVVGAEGRRQVQARYRSWLDSRPYYTVEFPYHVISGYAQEEVQLRRDLSAVIGLRLDDRSPGAAATSPRAALLWHPGAATDVKLLYGWAFRTPTLYEVEYAEPWQSKGNSELTTEKIRTVELVLDHRLGSSLMTTASLYHYRIDDLIEQRIDSTDGLAQFRNTGQVDAHGLELEATGRLPADLSGFASCSWQRTTDRDGERLPNSPSLMLKGGLARPLGRRLSLSTDWRYESGRLTLPREAGVAPVSTDDYLLGNLRLILRPPWSRRLAGMAFTATIDNLLDARYEVPGGVEHRQLAIAQDGRCWRLGAQYGF
jgi:iron complex outermembrane receptor protein